MTLTYIDTPQGHVNSEDVSVPVERMFRGAWQLNGDVIEVDMDKAREIWRDKIRTARTKEFDKLDASFMKALEYGDVPLQQSIAAQKQVLRDAPSDPLIDAATTPEELKAILPSGLVI